MAQVLVQDLVKNFGSFAALKSVSVQIPNHAITAILGPSGCGKTTLLRCIAGLIMPDSGTIHIGERDMTRVEPFRRNLGMVFQRASMFPHLTVYQNIAWGLQLRKYPAGQIPERVRAMLKLVKLDGMEQRAFSQLSGGQAQRVVIARALAPAPDLLLLDEPLSALDAKLREELVYELGEIQRKTGCTMVLVTHDQAEAMTMADHMLLMNAGQIVQQGTPLDIYRHPNSLFSANFIGVNNLIPGRLIRQDSTELPGIFQMDDGDVQLNLPAQSTSVVVSDDPHVWLCVRADDIDIVSGDTPLNGQPCVTIHVNKAALTGSTVQIYGMLGSTPIRINVGGGSRLDLLSAAGTVIQCRLNHLVLLPREG